jgi:UDP-N-acetylmuramoyl-L-alanyl-D-glutamate--2,6-diaminopimelate ligase
MLGMRIADLLAYLPGVNVINVGDAEVSFVAYDSRNILPGSMFVAVPGQTTDGHRYLEQAIAAGAAAVAVEIGKRPLWEPLLRSFTVPAIALPDTRAALPVIAAVLNGLPARSLGVIGVTGTDGKTSLSSLIEHVLRVTGHRPGLVSTAECRVGEERLLDTGRFTTPEAPELQEMLKRMVEAKCDWAVLEATSHGLAQHRLDCCEFDIAVFTTIGSDHLAFHGSREEYVRAKGRLFQMLDDAAQKSIPKTAVLNLDDAEFNRFRDLTTAQVISYGLSGDADVRGEELKMDGWGTAFTLVLGDRSYQSRVHGPGAFAVNNALAATAVCRAAGIDIAEISHAIQSWEGAPGRMQLIDEGQPFAVVVDFAHAPDSLARVLNTLRDTYRGRLITVFGCIGEREKDRRFAMGRVSATGSDFTIVTDDNPYTEDRDAIISEIVAGLEAAGRRAGHDFIAIPDRREAIAHALGMAVDEDVVLLAGKGHETEVHLPDGVYPCDDDEVARAVLSGDSRTTSTS